MMEGLGSGSWRPKNIRHFRIRIYNTGLLISFLFVPWHFFLYFLISWFCHPIHPFSSSFSSLSSLFCSFLLPLFPTLSFSTSYLFSLHSFRILMFSSLPLSCIYCRLLQSITDMLLYTVIFLLCAFRVENGGYYNKLELAYNCPVCQKLVCHRQTNSIFFTYHLRYGTPDKLQYRNDHAPSRDPRLLSLLSRKRNCAKYDSFLFSRNTVFAFLNFPRKF